MLPHEVSVLPHEVCALLHEVSTPLHEVATPLHVQQRGHLVQHGRAVRTRGRDRTLGQRSASPWRIYPQVFVVDGGRVVRTC